MKRKNAWIWVIGFLCMAAAAGLFLPGGASRGMAASPDEADQAVEEPVSGSETTPGQEAVRPMPVKAGLRLTDIRVESRRGEPVVKISATGRVRATTLVLHGPERFLVKIPGAILTWKPPVLQVGQASLQRIRAAQHGSEVWVVLDLGEAKSWKVATEPRGLSLIPESGASVASSKPGPRSTGPDPARELEYQAAAPATATPTALQAASYKVVDVAAEDTGEKTRLVVTTDGPVRYRVEREKRNEALTLWIHGAALAWGGRLSGLPKGALRRLSAAALVQNGEPVVRLEAQLTAASPYVVFKDQNQVVLELNNPNLPMESAPSRGNINSHVSVDFQNADFVSVLRALAQDAGFDLVVSPGAQDLPAALAQVTLTINDQPFQTVLDLLLKPRKMAYALGGNTLRIGLASEFSPETRVFVLKNVDVKSTNLKDTLEASVTEGARFKVIVDGAANRVIVTAIPSDLLKCESILNRLDTPSRWMTRTFTLNYAEVSKIAPLLKPMLSASATLDVNDRDNALMITDIPGNMLRLSSLIRSLDKKSKQVMIEAKIVEISLSNERDLGVRWTAGLHDPGSNPMISGSVNPAAIKSAGTLTIGTLQGGVDISATLSVLEAKGAANTISNPRIATLDNQAATLSASQNIPYNTSVVSNGVIRTGVEYLELPIILTVTPHISKNNQVLLSPTVLKVTTVVNPGNPPETSTRTAETQMLVADGETVAIGGMVRDLENTRESKVPLLGDIPVLGYLFKSTVVTKDKVELVVFLTPHVLD